MADNVQSCRRGSPWQAAFVIVSAANEAGNCLLYADRLLHPDAVLLSHHVHRGSLVVGRGARPDPRVVCRLQCRRSALGAQLSITPAVPLHHARGRSQMLTRTASPNGVQSVLRESMISAKWGSPEPAACQGRHPLRTRGCTPDQDASKGVVQPPEDSTGDDTVE